MGLPRSCGRIHIRGFNTERITLRLRVVIWSKYTATGVVLPGLVVAGSLLKSMTSVALIGMAPSIHPSMKPVDRMTIAAVVEDVPGEQIPG